jgi:hypothetical protein
MYSEKKGFFDLKTRYFKVTNEKLIFIKLININKIMMLKISLNKKYCKSELLYPKIVFIPPKNKK